LGVAQDITERKRSEEELYQSKKQLEDKITELERFNQLAIGRELRMIELKKEIAGFRKKLGEKEHPNQGDMR
jgi:hypothetical protein